MVAVSAKPAPSPAGTKGVDAGAIGELVVQIINTKEAFGGLAGVIAAWLTARATRSVEVTIDGHTLKLSGVRQRDQQAVLQAWLSGQRAAGKP